MRNKNNYFRKITLIALVFFVHYHASAQHTIPVSVHIARTSSGSSPRATTTQVDAEIASLNAGYSHLGITFVKCGQNFIDENRLWDQFDDGDQAEKDWLDNFTDPNVVNYFITDLEGGGHGKAVFPYKQKDWIAVNYEEMGTSTVVHEMGHYLNLHHTYSGVDGSNPARSSSLTIANAEGPNGWKYGDYLIDTPLDPKERDDFNSSCSYVGNQKDANGDSFHPDGRNFMGKGHNYCRDRFSSGQDARILRSVNIDRYYLNCNNSGNTNLTCANSSSISNFPHNDSFNGGYSNSPWVQARYGDELNWEIAPNTDSNSTGPENAQNGQTFMHAEASFTYTSSDDLSLLSPCYDLSDKTSADVSFYYHMYGSGTGTLRLEVSTNNGSSWSSLFSKSGQQHSSGSSSWTNKVVSLDNYVGQSIQLRMRATLGTSSKSDIAIDNITVNASGGGSGSAPVAEFTPNSTTITTGQSVNFIDNSTNSPTSWSWSFPGGSPASSASKNPSVTYNTAGTYNVTLTATNTNGSDSETKTGYITVQAAPACTNVTLSLLLDDYPEEISWLIADASGTTVASGGTYANSPDRSTITEVKCLASGCYTFTINDSYGDGICCNYGPGSYTLTDQAGTVLVSGGTFGSSETKNFCVGGSSSRRASTVTLPNGIEEEHLNNRFTIYPTVTSNKLNVLLPESMHSSELQIISLSGKIYRRKIVTKQKFSLNVADLPKGFYILRTSDGKRTYTHKFIKK